MQNLLRANKGLLAERGIGMILRADMMADSRLDMRAWHRRKAFDPRMRGAPKRFIAAVEAMPFDHVIVSEESLLSTMPAVREHSFYPFAEKFLECLEPLSQHFDLRLRFVVRRQDRYVESVYGFRLVRGLPEDFRTFLAAFPEECFDWCKFTAALDRRGLTNNSRFAVMDHWLGLELNQYLAALVDIDPVGLALNSRGNPSLPAVHLPLLLAMNHAGLMPDLSERKTKLLPMIASLAEPNMEAVAELLVAADVKKLDQCFDTEASTGFAADARAKFLSVYRGANKRFLEHAAVRTTPSIWG